MRFFHTTDHDRDLGREIHHYSFENEDRFVDRGKEISTGVRPPHRKRELDRDRRRLGRRGNRGGIHDRSGRDRYGSSGSLS